MVAVLLRFDILVPTGRVPVRGGAPTEYDVLDQATGLHRQAAEAVDVAQLPPREAIVQAAAPSRTPRPSCAVRAGTLASCWCPT